jgi:hypothetical protein
MTFAALLVTQKRDKGKVSLCFFFWSPRRGGTRVATQNHKDAFLSRTILSQRVGQKSEKCIEKFTDIWYYIK